MRVRRHHRVAGRRCLMRPAPRRAARARAGPRESAGAGTGGSRRRPVRCASGRCAAGGPHRRSVRSARARRSCGRLRRSRARSACGFGVHRDPDGVETTRRSRRRPAAASTPARPSASAHAWLPAMSSSTSRRSTASDLPYSKTSRSGSESNRPDHRVDIRRSTPARSAGLLQLLSWCRSARPATWRPTTRQSPLKSSETDGRRRGGKIDGGATRRRSASATSSTWAAGASVMVRRTLPSAPGRVTSVRPTPCVPAIVSRLCTSSTRGISTPLMLTGTPRQMRSRPARAASSDRAGSLVSWKIARAGVLDGSRADASSSTRPQMVRLERPSSVGHDSGNAALPSSCRSPSLVNSCLGVFFHRRARRDHR